MRNLHVGGVEKRGSKRAGTLGEEGDGERVPEARGEGWKGRLSGRASETCRAIVRPRIEKKLGNRWAKESGKTMGRKKMEPAVVLLQGEECGGVAFGCPGLVLAYDGESTDGRGGQGVGELVGRKPTDLGALVVTYERCSIVVGGRADEKDVHVSALVAVRVLHQVV